jgi:hypothetical protein
MGNAVVTALRVVIVLGMIGSVLVQAVLGPLLAIDLEDAPAGVRWPVVVILLLGVLVAQVVMVCVWQLLTLVREGTVFSHRSFRYVDAVTAALAGGACLFFALGVVLAPGEAVAPGVVLLLGGASAMTGGVALLVVVLRALLEQAVARDAEATELRARLDALS